MLSFYLPIAGDKILQEQATHNATPEEGQGKNGQQFLTEQYKCTRKGCTPVEHAAEQAMGTIQHIHALQAARVGDQQ